jgi:GH15 family glucan-1,4-alpha-glucosidase
LPELGLISATDPRFAATVEAIGRELRDGDYIFRYRHADDFGVPRNAFTVCSFWYVNALAHLGRTAEAREAFERLLSRCNHVGLFSEDIDPATHEHWGNYPQTYSMVGVISSALRLSRPWEEVGPCQINPARNSRHQRRRAHHARRHRARIDYGHGRLHVA